jgi:predicted HTH domain antitoxin
MAIHLEIPDAVADAMRLPGDERHQRILIELAVSLYAQGILSFGKARQLCEMTKYEFGILLGKRGIPRHYSQEDFQDDLAYARG